MKTGSVLVRLFAGVPMVAGLCLMQGCATSTGESSTTETPAAISNVPPEVVATPVASTNVVKIAPTPAASEKEKAVLKPIPPMTTAYTVKANESITEIAAKYGKRWQDVLAVNPELKKDRKLRAGQVIQLPNPVDLAHPKAVAHKAKKVEKKPAAAEAKPEAATAAPAAGEATYTVAKGDTIAKIAAKHHVKRTDLEKANSLTAKSKLKLGQKLVIPAKGEAPAAAAAAPAEAAPASAPVAAPAPDAGAVPPPPMEAAPAAAPMGSAAAPAAAAPAAHAAPAAEPKTYQVKEGEDVYAVAIRWGVSPAELKALNNLSSSDLTPGQVLKIPVVAPAAP